MKHKVTLPWNAAAWRQSTYEPRVRKVHGPVGEKWLIADSFGGYCDRTHPCCGHHVCSCESVEYWRSSCGGDPVRCKPEPREYKTPLTKAAHAAMLSRRGMTQAEWSVFVHAAADDVHRGLPKNWTLEEFRVAFHARIYAE